MNIDDIMYKKALKSSAIEKIVEKPCANVLSVAGTGKTVIQDVVRGVCPTCGQMVGTFRDILSEKEYQISGMCQKCQDTVFTEEVREGR